MSDREGRKVHVALFCNLFWILFSLVTCIESYRVRLGTITKPGSGFFPFSAGIVMLALGLVALFQSMRARGRGGKTAGGESFRWWSIAVILAATIAYALTLETIGFLINTFLYVTILLKVVEPQTWKTSVIGGLIAAVAASLIFNVVFKAQIPSGIFGF